VHVEVDDKSATVKLGTLQDIPTHCEHTYREDAVRPRRSATSTDWDAARKGTQHLSDVELSVLARELYEETVTEIGEKPGEPGELNNLAYRLADALAQVLVRGAITASDLRQPCNV
jgi:hypothetical protein